MKKISFFVSISAAICLAIYCFFASRPSRELEIGNSAKAVFLYDNGLFLSTIASADTVSAFLQEKNLQLSEHDRIIPDPASPLISGMNISIKRALKIKIVSDGKTSDVYSLENSVRNALWENNIHLGEDDFTKPALNEPLKNNATIEVVRVDIREEVVKKDIPFETTSNEDDKLSWRTKKITQKGEKGIKEITYKVVSHNGKEISRKALNETITKKPTPEIVTQGTYMKLGKGKEGQGTWYAFKGGMFAASTTLPRGSYAKVTNTENGKSVVVQINDYGPQGKGRIIDLDKVAFEKLASLGAGVIGVKVEPILN
jgi:uncharacterized protein YabE (DUF348 family)